MREGATPPGSHAPLAVAHLRPESATAKVEAIDQELAQVLAQALGQPPSVLLFFASSRLDFDALADALAARYPRCTVAGCTTAGEIGALGCASQSVSVLALGAPARAHAVVLESQRSLTFERAAAVAANFDRLVQHEAPTHPAERVILTLTDGLSGSEEHLLAALGAGLPGIPIVGGSAGDDFNFERTRVALNGQVSSGAALVILLEAARPVVTFAEHHYRPEGEPAVVTAADPSTRRVLRVDGRPAREWFLDRLDLDPTMSVEALRAHLEAHPVGFGIRAGDRYYMRGVMSVKEDALLMGGALERGAIIHPMRAGDLIASTRDGLEAARARVAAPGATLLFNCGGRIWEARAHGLMDELSDALRGERVAGFTTYGEQFGPLVVNHTLTGLVFGGGA